MSAAPNGRPVGIFDSGVGGLTVFHAVEQAVPGEPLVYLGDTARVPYGTRSADTVRRYAHEAGRFMAQREIKLLVVACNTASAVALDVLAEACAAPVMGVIEPGARQAVERSRSGRIGVIGTRATIGSGAYADRIRELRPDAHVASSACPLFVPLAEEGWVDDDVARGVARRYLEPLQEQEIDTLVLGCTHYPLLKRTIGEVLGDGVALVDSAEAVATEVRRRLDGGVAASSGGDVEHRFYVTDVPEPFQAVAERFLGRPIRNLRQTEDLSA